MYRCVTGLDTLQTFSDPLYEDLKQRVQALIARSHVLIRGESGVGKTHLALDSVLQSRSEGLLPQGKTVVLSCKGNRFSRALEEFVGSAKTPSVLILEDIQNLSREDQILFVNTFKNQPQLQVKCLALLTETTYNQNFHNLQNSFAQMFPPVHITIPPLRFRKDLIWPMAQHFASQERNLNGQWVQGVAFPYKSLFESCLWHGNLTELKSFLTWVSSRETSTLLNSKHIVEGLRIVDQSVDSSSTEASLSENEKTQRDSLTFKIPDVSEIRSIQEYRKQIDAFYTQDLMKRCLAKYHGNVTQAAKFFNMDRANFLRMLRKYKIVAEAYRVSRNHSRSDAA